jgi:hypothetical protein
MSATNTFEETILKYLLNGTTPPAQSVYLGLSTTSITEAGGNVTEPTGTYARINLNNVDGFGAIAFPNGDITGSNGDNVSNAVAITFVAASVGYTVLDYFIATSPTTGGGTVLHFNTLSSPLVVGIGQQVNFAIGTLEYSAL